MKKGRIEKGRIEAETVQVNYYCDDIAPSMMVYTLRSVKVVYGPDGGVSFQNYGNDLTVDVIASSVQDAEALAESVYPRRDGYTWLYEDLNVRYVATREALEAIRAKKAATTGKASAIHSCDECGKAGAMLTLDDTRKTGDTRAYACSAKCLAAIALKDELVQS